MADNGHGDSPQDSGPEIDFQAEARKLCDKALAYKDSGERLTLARRALEFDHLSADSYTIFAQEAMLEGRWEEALGYAKEAVGAAEEDFDSKVRKLVDGSSRQLWRRKVLRPYLRARAELARSVHGGAPGDPEALEEALEIARDVVGRAGFEAGEGPEEIRTLEADLALWLVESERVDEAFYIIDNVAQELESAPMRYTAALAFLMVHGSHSRAMYGHAQTLFVDAVASNPSIAVLLLSDDDPRSVVLERPAWVRSAGDTREALLYALFARPVWQKYPGALQMLRDAREELAEIHTSQVTTENVPACEVWGEYGLDEARRLCRVAFATEDPVRRLELARRAHSLSDRCADVYTLLVEEADSPESARQLSEKAVSLAREDESQEGVESYLRAVSSLALAERALGEVQRAIGHCCEALELDPEDELGMSHILLHLLINAWRDREAWEILEAYDCDCVHWLYSRALLLFRRSGADGDGDESEKVTANPNDPIAAVALAYAVEEYPAAPAYLLGNSIPPASKVSAVGSILDPDEAAAVYYAGAAYGAWSETPGALAWLRSYAEEFSGNLLREGTADDQGRARLFTWREPAGEDPPLAAYKAALEALVHDRAQLHGLRTERTDLVQGFSHFAAIGVAGEILEMAQEFLEDDICDFHVIVEDEEDLEIFDQLGVDASLVSSEIDPEEFFG